ncbi:MAG: DUF2155 domain-containing protein [Pseudomonadota bacterium]
MGPLTRLSALFRCIVFFACCAALPSTAQDVSNGTGGILRVLDKTASTTVDLSLAVGQTQQVGAIAVALKECRYPADNPTGDAFAFLEVSEDRLSQVLFSGWMIASAPALSALEHHRYDVWVIRCTTS